MWETRSQFVRCKSKINCWGSRYGSSWKSRCNHWHMIRKIQHWKKEFAIASHFAQVILKRLKKLCDDTRKRWFILKNLLQALLVSLTRDACKNVDHNYAVYTWTWPIEQQHYRHLLRHQNATRPLSHRNFFLLFLNILTSTARQDAL